MKLSTRLLFTVLPLVTSLQAAVPLTVNYQSTVYDSTGTAIGAAAAVNRKVIFRLYDASTAGNKLWTEEQTVTIYKGEFSVVLGNGTTATGTASTEIRPVLDTVFTSNSTTRYLEVMVDNGDGSITAADTPISPRQLITTTFYAFHAQVADGIASSSDLTINPVTGTATNYGLGWYGTGRLWGTTAVDGPVLYGNAGGALGSNASGTKNIALLWNATGQVGIGATGTFTTNNKLTLQGDDTTTAAKQLVIRGQTDSNEALYLGFDTTNNRATLQSYTSVSTPTAGPLLLNPSGGNIGVGTGTVAPIAKLTVEGPVSATGTGGYVFGTGGDADGGLFSPADGAVTLKTNGSERLRIDSTGKVGIGTTTPNSALEVTGNIGASSISTSGNITMAHDTSIYGTNTAGGTTEACFWPRSGNATYLNYGSAGFNIRNSSNALKMFVNNDGKVGIGTGSPINFLSVDAGSSTATASISTASAHFGNGDVASFFGVYDGTGVYGAWLQPMRVSDGYTFPLSLNPNGGNVGIGTKSTVAKLTVEGSVSATGAGGYVFGTGGDADGGLFSPADNILTLKTNSSERVRIDSAGNVGIGTTSPTQGKLVVSGTGSAQTYNGTQVDYFTYGGQITRLPAGSYGMSIYASDRIAGSAILAFSDERIKKIEGHSDGAMDLRTLLGIEITDYRYKDVVAKGNDIQKKVIAQQVESVYPQAVTQTTDVVPDIYQKAAIKDGWVTLATNLKVGERVRLIGEKAGEGIHEVLEVRDGAFRTAFHPATDAVFVYGREVKDFRSVDYEAIAMLNVSATQQIKKEKDLELKALKEQLAAAHKVASAQEARIAALEAGERTRQARNEAQQAEQGAKLAALDRLLNQQLVSTRPAAVQDAAAKTGE